MLLALKSITINININFIKRIKMNGGSYIALSGIMAEESKLNAVTNNLSNVNTVGYKSDNTVFADFLSKKAMEVSDSGEPKPYIDKVYPVSLYNYVNMSNGDLKKTGNQLDVAIHGSGFFVLKTPGGIKYTRDGSFSLNSGGELVSQDGYPVIGTNGKPIILDENGSNITIKGNGIINVTDPSTGQELFQGRILTVGFKNPQYLSKYGDNMFSSTGKSGDPVQQKDFNLLQGYVEESNVNEIKGMVDMINISNTYSYMIDALKSFAQVDNYTINTVGAAV